MTNDVIYDEPEKYDLYEAEQERLSKAEERENYEFDRADEDWWDEKA